MYTKNLTHYSKMLIVFGLMMFFSPDLLAQEHKKYPEKPRLVTFYCMDKVGDDFVLDTVSEDIEVCREARKSNIPCKSISPFECLRSGDTLRFSYENRKYILLHGTIAEEKNK